MSFPRLATAAYLLAGLTLTGCAGYTVKPVKPAAMPRADAPLPLKVGVRVGKPRFEWQGMGMSTAVVERRRGWRMFKPMIEQADDIGGKFVRALQASSAFSQVDEVVGSGAGHDLIINADFSGKYTQDPGTFGKSFITGFLLFLPAPVMVYEDSYFAAAEMTVNDGAGNLIRKYVERQDVGTAAMLFSAGAPSCIAAGIESASSNLAAKLVKLIIDDRDGYKPSKRAPEARKVAKAEPAPQPEPEAAKPEPAKAAPEPESADARRMRTFRIDEDDAPARPSAVRAAARVDAPAAAPGPKTARQGSFRIDDEPARPARAEPEARVAANSEKAHAELAAEEEARREPPPAPRPQARAELTSAEELEIDEQVMP